MKALLAVPFPADAPPDQRFTFALGDVQLEVPRALLSPPVWQALTEGWYEADELAALAGLLRPDDVVLELGAGLGFLSASLARRPEPRRIVAVEADPRLLPVILRTHELNGTTVQLVHAVAAAADGVARFHAAESFWESSSAPIVHAQACVLPARGLASLLAEVRPTVLVVDIEGAESTVFQDCPLPGVRAVVMELHREAIGLAGIGQVFATLNAAGMVYQPDLSCRAVVAFERADIKQ